MGLYSWCPTINIITRGMGPRGGSVGERQTVSELRCHFKVSVKEGESLELWWWGNKSVRENSARNPQWTIEEEEGKSLSP